MVHIPDDEDESSASEPPLKRPVDTDEARQLEDRKPTGPVRKAVPPHPSDGARKRRTEILSLDPPKRNRGPALQRDRRLDGMAGPQKITDRNRNLMGNIGRDRHPTGPQQQNPGRPIVRRSQDGKPVQLGGDSTQQDGILARRKPTRRIPKPGGGGLVGEAPALDRMGSDRHPSVRPPSEPSVPPVVNIPVKRSGQRRPSASVEGNTLAGVSAEELLGEEGRQMLEQMRRREIAASGSELIPQSEFLAGPKQAGQAAPAQKSDSDEEPVARDSAAHDEMEQRAGHLLWLQGVITRDEIEDALNSDEPVSEAARGLLESSTFTDQITLHRFLARHESLEPVDLELVRPSERALAALRPAIARSYRVVPIEKLGQLLLVAASFPFDPKRLLELRRLTSSKVKLFVATELEIDQALSRYYPMASATLRSPKPTDRPPRDDDDDGFDASAITGEGEALVANYDPTLPGSDSGLYPAVGGQDPPESEVGIAEVEDDAGLPSQGGNLESGPEDHDPFGD